jgi:hypothetical protein
MPRTLDWLALATALLPQAPAATHAQGGVPARLGQHLQKNRYQAAKKAA